MNNLSSQTNEIDESAAGRERPVADCFLGETALFYQEKTQEFFSKSSNLKLTPSTTSTSALQS